LDGTELGDANNSSIVTLRVLRLLAVAVIPDAKEQRAITRTNQPRSKMTPATEAFAHLKASSDIAEHGFVRLKTRTHYSRAGLAPLRIGVCHEDITRALKIAQDLQIE